MVDILFSLDYPPIMNIFRLPSEPCFSRLISCTNSYIPRMFQCIWNVCQFQFSLITCTYINMNIFTYKLNHTTCYEIIISNTKISSLRLMFQHKQFDSNYLTKHIFSQNIFLEHYFGNSKTLGYYSRKITNQQFTL